MWRVWLSDTTSVLAELRMQTDSRRHLYRFLAGRRVTGTVSGMSNETPRTWYASAQLADELESLLAGRIGPDELSPFVELHPVSVEEG